MAQSREDLSAKRRCLARTLRNLIESSAGADRPMTPAELKTFDRIAAKIRRLDARITGVPAPSASQLRAERAAAIEGLLHRLHEPGFFMDESVIGEST